MSARYRSSAYRQVQRLLAERIKVLGQIHRRMARHSVQCNYETARLSHS
jgi:hypothetical protein